MACLFKRSNGYWYVSYYELGHQKQKSLKTKVKKIADLRYSEFVQSQLNRELGILSPMEIGEFFGEWLDHVKLHFRPKTWTRYELIVRTIEAYRKRNAAIRWLTDLDVRFFEKYKAHRATSVSVQTVNNELKTVAAALNYAIRCGYLEQNPLKKVQRFKPDKKRQRFFSAEEVQLILENCTPRYYPIFLMLATTGMRRGELENLQWQDIDLEHKFIRIRLKKHWKPKTEERDIPVCGELANVLAQMQYEQDGNALVFPTSSGKPMANLYRYFRRLCRRLGIEDANLHTFRHTAASHLVRSGLSIRIVQRFLGHKNIQTTMQYSHLAPDDVFKASDRLEEMLLGSRKPVSKVREKANSYGTADCVGMRVDNALFTFF